jgi:hypothetical protein
MTDGKDSKTAGAQRLVLSGKDLSRMSMCNRDFTGAYLEGCDFTGADLRGCDFTGADVVGCDFTGADLRGAEIGNALMCGCGFQSSSVHHAQFGTGKGSMRVASQSLSYSMRAAEDGGMGRWFASKEDGRLDAAVFIGCDFNSADFKYASFGNYLASGRPVAIDAGLAPAGAMRQELGLLRAMPAKDALASLAAIEDRNSAAMPAPKAPAPSSAGLAQGYMQENERTAERVLGAGRRPGLCERGQAAQAASRAQGTKTPAHRPGQVR